MNRRNFIGMLGTALAAAAAPQVLVGQSFKWKKPAGNLLYVINPEWVRAEYEVSFWFTPPRPTEIVPVIYKRIKGAPEIPDGMIRLPSPFPARLDKDQKRVFPFKAMEEVPYTKAELLS